MVASDSRGDALLSQVGWFRIVLDEAHFIRRSTTKFFRCVTELDARSRWCLTGTPIQNRLDDLGALLAFVNIEPFNRIGAFRQHISLPIQDSSRDRHQYQKHLQRLIDAFCLRRETSLLDLQAIEEITQSITLSREEKDYYQQTKASLSDLLKLGSEDSPFSNRFGIFQAQLHLRRICNHGTYQKPFDPETGSHDAGSRGNMQTYTVIHGDDICRQCNTFLTHQEIFARPNSPCQIHLCTGCLAWHRARCVACGSSSFEAAMPQVSFLQSSRIDDHRSLRETGLSTKMSQLVHDLQHRKPESKSIVFSCWTSTLDLVGWYLQAAHIRYGRVDGDLLFKKRKAVLDEFEYDPASTVLIMTTGVGALGLNLIAANSIYLLEPQWNPSVESQAIGRALRIGQQHKVIVTRYVVEDTIEKDIRRLQFNKTKIAKLARPSQTFNT